jgi:hypothetical protein
MGGDLRGQGHQEQVGQEQREGEGLLTFAQFLEAMYAQKHTGPVTLHMKQGHPYSIDIPREPRRIALTRAAT